MRAILLRVKIIEFIIHAIVPSHTYGKREDACASWRTDCHRSVTHTFEFEFFKDFPAHVHGCSILKLHLCKLFQVFEPVDLLANFYFSR